MKGSTGNGFVIVSVLLCLVLVPPAVSAEDLVFEVSGVVDKTIREDSIIIIDPFDPKEDPLLIKGFPYNFVERELESALSQPKDSIAIEEGDCITILFIVDEVGLYNQTINRALALVEYCDECNYDDTCYVDPVGIVFLEQEDNEYSPVNKNPNSIKSYNWKNTQNKSPN